MKYRGLSTEHISVSIENSTILTDINFHMEVGEIVAVLGPSGCGKSTLLKAIAGILPLDTGEIKWDSKSLTSVPTHKRGIGLMFQSYALFPHRNVEANIRFSLEIDKVPPAKMALRVKELLDLVDLRGYENRTIESLSGGERQRVALARALAPNPKVLMLDEPFNSLDKSMRNKLLTDVREILKSLEITTIYVTHDSDEASKMADSVLIMDKGRIIQRGVIKELHDHPKFSVVAELLGLQTLWSPAIHHQNKTGMFSTPWGTKEFPLERNEPITALLRPEHVHIAKEGAEGVVINEIVTSGQSFYTCELSNGFKLTTKLDRDLSIGELITLNVDLQDIEILIESIDSMPQQ